MRCSPPDRPRRDALDIDGGFVLVLFCSIPPSTSQADLRGDVDAPAILAVTLEVEHGGFQRDVEHERVEGNVHVAQDPGDADEPEGAPVDHDEGAGDRDEDVPQEGDGGKGDVALDSTVKIPHLEGGRGATGSFYRGLARVRYVCVSGVYSWHVHRSMHLLLIAVI